MKIQEKIDVINSLIREKKQIEIKALDCKDQEIISKQLFLLKEIKVNLMHSIGLQTNYEKRVEELYYGR